MYYSGNRYLSMEEMETNALYIYDYLSARGWTKNAVAGLLGNLQTESTINPAIWQSLNAGNTSGGFGLVQWTPSTKYTNWASANSLDPSAMDSNLLRILYEVDNNLQWGNDSKGNKPPFNFLGFTKSNLSPSTLGILFLHHYERPAVYNQPARGTQATAWYVFIGGSATSRPAFPTTANLPITTPYGWRTHPISGLPDLHLAIDIGGGGVDRPIYATQSGVILRNYYTSGGGYSLVIQHTGDAFYSQYLHLKSASPIPEGATVNKGQLIATMGTTGSSTGIHLHFAICKTGTGWEDESQTIDPLVYLEMGFDPDPSARKKKSYKVWLTPIKRGVIIK